MASFCQDLFLIRRSKSYFGHINYVTKPTIFAFRQQSQANIVRNDLAMKKVEVQGNDTTFYKLCYNNKVDTKAKPLKCFEVEHMGLFDLSIYAEVNGVHVHIVDDIIEDDDANIYLVNRNTNLEPITINSSLMQMHFNKLLNETNKPQ